MKLGIAHWCEHVPKLVETSRESKANTLRNPQVQTDRTFLTYTRRHNP